MIDAKHIAALEAWLNKTRDEQNQLIAKLREAEGEAERLRGQIAALDEIAQQAESMIDNALVLMRDGMRGAAGKGRNEQEVSAPPPAAPDLARVDDPLRFQPVQSKQRVSAGNIAYLGKSRPLSIRSNKVEAISNRFADRTITQACTLLLREAGVPMHVNELYGLLVAGGMEFKGNNPTISVAVSLNRNRRFRKVGPGTFDLMMREASQAAS